MSGYSIAVEEPMRSRPIQGPIWMLFEGRFSLLCSCSVPGQYGPLPSFSPHLQKQEFPSNSWDFSVPLHP
ncbi:hypothetical protein Y032_0049g1752 [Ancylostoma ceylanicum]|uniref:Uncharacterized protein n=1 Tax=Ancylostoma ceylanicum TaxID=53326 RepID=A0A016UAW8_9BILA|nr:hypothetical protein Y032_0049g1752 [Ancylostoma ceylanicum]